MVTVSEDANTQPCSSESDLDPHRLALKSKNNAGASRTHQQPVGPLHRHAQRWCPADAHLRADAHTIKARADNAVQCRSLLHPKFTSRLVIQEDNAVQVNEINIDDDVA